MTTFNDVVIEVQQTLQGYGFNQPRATFLTTPVTATDLSFVVTDATDFYEGIAEIEDEVVYISSVDTGTNTLTIAPDGRGFYGTTAAAHAVNARITMAPVWPKNRVKSAINDAITGTWPTLFGKAQTSFTFNASVNTYELPADCEKVLEVSATTIGPSREQQRIHRFSQSMVDPTSEFTSGKTITLQEAVDPSQTVTVNYVTAPKALTNPTDDFTATGLRDTAKLCVVYGACAKLVSLMDTPRLVVSAAQTDEYAQINQVGSAAQIAKTLLGFYQLELERERRRLRETTPVILSLRSR